VIRENGASVAGGAVPPVQRHHRGVQTDLDQDPELIKSLAFTKNLPALPLS
jgi:hypothetical protein